MIASKLPFSDRAQRCHNKVAKRLCEIIAKKSSNLILGADVNTAAELLHIAEQFGPKICALKTHIDILTDFTSAFIYQLKELAQKHEFLIFEDRKLADIGQIIQSQYCGGSYKIAEWADLVTVHTIAGPDSIKALEQAAKASTTEPRGILLIVEMSSKGQLAKGAYTSDSIAMTSAAPDFIAGFISQTPIYTNPGYLQITPGVQLSNTQDAFGQRYRDPIQAIQKEGNDLIIVGRGILNANDPLAKAEQYREAAWTTYIRCCA